ncbi:MAG: hypothetical protein AMXMBFR23_01690 [Chloroflexota bacterium]
MPRSDAGAPVRAVGYVRVSDESQVDGYSLDAQRREIARYCERRGYELTQVYADEGVSGRSDRLDHRPQLSALLRDAGQRGFDVVVVHTIDRWARNVGVQRQALQLLAAAEVGFASVTENFDFTTPAGRLMLTMMGSVSEFFSDQLGVHVSKAKRERAELGLPAGPIPFGYRSPDGSRSTPIIEATEARLVREAFARRARGESYGTIAEWLNGTGQRPSRAGRGDLWTAHRVRDLLACAFYRGVVTHRGSEFPGRHEAIVDEALFARVQARKGARARQRRTAGDHGLLQGRVRCHACGQTLQSDRTQYGAPMYRERHSQPCPTNNRSAVASDFDAQIEAILGALHLPDDWVDRLSAALVEHREGPSVATLREQLRRLGRIYSYGDISDAEYEARRAEIDAQLKQATAEVRPGHEEAAALFRDLPAFWAEATRAEKHRIVRLLFERVYVDLAAKQVTAIVPTAEFGFLLQHALEAAERSDIYLVPVEDLDALDALHAYANGERVHAWTSEQPEDAEAFTRLPPTGVLEMVETGENTSPTVPHSLWLPYPVDPGWGAHNVGWLQAA